MLSFSWSNQILWSLQQIGINCFCARSYLLDSYHLFLQIKLVEGPTQIKKDQSVGEFWKLFLVSFNFINSFSLRGKGDAACVIFVPSRSSTKKEEDTLYIFSFWPFNLVYFVDGYSWWLTIHHLSCHKDYQRFMISLYNKRFRCTLLLTGKLVTFFNGSWWWFLSLSSLLWFSFNVNS